MLGLSVAIKLFVIKYMKQLMIIVLAVAILFTTLLDIKKHNPVPEFRSQLVLNPVGLSVLKIGDNTPTWFK